jgi:hypothetical protein
MNGLDVASIVAASDRAVDVLREPAPRLLTLCGVSRPPADQPAGTNASSS